MDALDYHVLEEKHVVSLEDLQKFHKKLYLHIVFTDNIYKSIHVQEGVQKFTIRNKIKHTISESLSFGIAYTVLFSFSTTSNRATMQISNKKGK